jgi:hypothetical protein
MNQIGFGLGVSCMARLPNSTRDGVRRTPGDDKSASVFRIDAV